MEVGIHVFSAGLQFWLLVILVQSINSVEREHNQMKLVWYIFIGLVYNHYPVLVALMYWIFHRDVKVRYSPRINIAGVILIVYQFICFYGVLDEARKLYPM